MAQSHFTRFGGGNDQAALEEGAWTQEISDESDDEPRADDDDEEDGP